MIWNSLIQIYYEKELGQFEAKLKNTNYANEEEEYRAKMIPQQIDETKAALKDTEDRLSNGKNFAILGVFSNEISARFYSENNSRRFFLLKRTD